MDERPSGTVTFLFTDIEGSTRLWQDNPAEMATAMSVHDRLIQTISDRHCGHVFARAGDGVAIAFTSAHEAVIAAREFQEELASKAEVGGHPLRVRIGMNTGEAVERDGDYLGTAVNLGARVRDLAHGGEVLLSAATRDLVYRSLAGAERIRKLRPRRLKGIDHLEHVYRVGDRSLPWPPSAATAKSSVVAVTLIAVAAWTVSVVLDGDGPTTTTSQTTTTMSAAETTATGMPNPTSGLMTIEADTVLTGDHEGRIVVKAHDVVLDCNGHVVRDPAPSDRNGQPNHLEAGILVYRRNGVTVQNCVVVDHWTGIAVVEAEDAWLHDNSLDHSRAPRDFTVRTGIGLTECGRCTVNANTVTDIHGDGIDLYRAFDSEIYDNVVEGPGIAIRVIDSEYNTIRSNSLANGTGGPNSKGGIGIGLFGRNSHNMIHDNTTRGFLIGIELDGWSSLNEVRSNRGIFNEHDIATCLAQTQTNVVEAEPGDQISNLEDFLRDQCP